MESDEARKARLRKEVDDALANFGWWVSDVPMTARQREQARDWLIDATSAIAAEREEADKTPLAAAMAAIDRLAKPPSPIVEAIDAVAARLNCNAPSPDGQPCWKLRGHVGAHQAACGEPYVAGSGMAGVVTLDLSDVDEAG